MKRKRRIGTTAALGALTAGLAFGGLASARADELSDLQANVQLLQKEVAQLQQRGADPAVQPGSFHALYHGSSFLMPGTNTSIAVSGYVKFDAFWWLNGGPPNGNPAASDALENGTLLSAPLDLHGQKLGGLTFNPPVFNPHSRGNGVVEFTARESRLRVQTETPTAWGPATTAFEFDFFGCNDFSCSALDRVSNPIVPRLRHAVGTLGPFLGGQTWSLTDDLEAAPETIDFGGPIGEMGKSRVPQVRYTWKGPYGISAAGSLEVGETTAITPDGLIANDATSVSALLAVNPEKATWPVPAGYVQWNQPWGHLRLQGLLVPMDFEDGHLIQREFLGYGGGFAGNVRPGWFGWGKDNILFQFTAGEGIGPWLNGFDHPSLATNFGGTGLYGNIAGPTTAAAASLIHVTTVTAWGGVAGYEHWWLPNLRSTAYFGIDHQDVPENLVGPVQAMLAVNKEILNAGVNLIWQPVSFVNTGIEFDWGQRQTTGNAFGEMNIIEYEFQVLF